MLATQGWIFPGYFLIKIEENENQKKSLAILI